MDNLGTCFENVNFRKMHAMGSVNTFVVNDTLINRVHPFKLRKCVFYIYICNTI